MKKKKPFYLNTYLWSILAFAVSFFLFDTNEDLSTGIGLFAVFLFALSVLLSIIRFFKWIFRVQEPNPPMDIPEPVQKPSPIPVEVEAQSKSREIKPACSASFFDTDVIYSGIPQEYCGNKLAYSYDDVKFNCISERLTHSIPDNMRLTFKLDQHNRKDEQSAALFYKNILIGYLYNNKLKTMVMDFAADPDRNVLILGREWEGEPMVKLCFYKPDKNQVRFNDDEDDEDDDEDDDDYDD